MIALTPVTGSTQVSAWGYDPAQQVLTVVFHGKPTRYDYQQVPADVADAFSKAESKGRFIGQHIKNKYQFEKIEPESAAASAEQAEDASA